MSVVDTTLAEEAVRVVSGDRPNAYDVPERNLQRIADVWSVVLESRHGVTLAMTARDVALMMVGLKFVREAYKPSRDNKVDLIGYTLISDGL